MDAFSDAPGNTLADAAVIVYNEDGSINRESFGRPLSQLERALCDALDKREALLRDLGFCRRVDIAEAIAMRKRAHG